MMTLEEICALVSEVRCPPFEFRIGFSRFDQSFPTPPPWPGEPIVPVEVDCGALFLQAMLWRRDNGTGVYGWGFGAKYLLSPHMTRGEVVKKCFVAARDYAEHEVREAFTWRGRRILGPHIDIEELFAAAEKTEARK